MKLFLLAFSVVMASLQWWPRLLSLPELIMLSGSVVIIKVLSRKNVPLVWIICGITVGIYCAHLHAWHYQSTLSLVAQQGRDITIVGRVNSLTFDPFSDKSIVVNVTEIDRKAIPVTKRPKIKLYYPSSFAGGIPQAGQILRWHIKYRPPNGRVNQRGYDAEKSALLHGLVGTARVISEVLLDEKVSWRQQLFNRMAAATAHLPMQRYLLALSFGYRGLLTQQDWQQLANSGLSHLLAISGLHIGITFMLGWGGGRVCLSLLSEKHFKAYWPLCCGVITATLYCWLSGWGISAQRALLMSTLAAYWLVSSRRQPPWSIWLYALFLCLVVMPFSSFGNAFWLSFGAVLMLIIIGRGVEPFRQHGRLKQLVMVQLGLSLLMLPLQQLFFSGTSLLSPALNLLAIPWCSFLVIPVLMVALIFTFLGVSSVAAICWHATDRLIAPIVKGMALVPDAMAAFSSNTMLLFVAGIGMLLSAFFLWRRMLPVIALLLMIAALSTSSQEKGWSLDVLDVGHGLAVIIKQGNDVVLYDTGWAWRSGSIADSVITPVLKYQQVKRIKGIILSHADNDHAGSWTSLVEAWRPEWLRSSDERKGFLPCISGEQWQWNALTFKVVWPKQLVERAKNGDSCVVSVSDGYHRVLLTGDIDSVGELLMLQEERDWAHHVITVPHHGSKSSSTEKFIAMVKPQYALVSVARYNPWRLPSQRVKQRYEHAKAHWLSTHEHGQVHLEFDRDQINWIGQRSSIQNYWYRKLFVAKGVSK
ncbi:DNA internalization-related competence protein ComEC/Rec2 [Thaumasiovibrio sp. DFM-14]|uniref:DNA internalization-related competence protein ComEC/Rec2 n=1 Tax=Thaumasiovibrio sp. DFM-14 TaxID=3384792 RepID=UPI0039A26FDC